MTTHTLHFRHCPVINRDGKPSSNIESVAWTSNLLEVLFRSGGLYLYTDFPRNMYRNFLRSRSKGKWFHKKVLGRYNYQKLEAI